MPSVIALAPATLATDGEALGFAAWKVKDPLVAVPASVRVVVVVPANASVTVPATGVAGSV